MDGTYTILGMGKTGHSMACYLLNKNKEVICWNRDKVVLEKIENRGITLTGVLEGKFYPKVEKDIVQSVAKSKYIIIMTTAEGHNNIASLLKGNLKENQRIIIINGNWGAFEFYKILKDEIKSKNIIIAETDGQLLVTPTNENGNVFLKSMKNSLSIGTIPANKSKILLDEIKNIFPQFSPADNVIETSLSNPNSVVHTSLNLFNLARVENGESYLMYATNDDGQEYTTPLAVEYMEKVDKERIDIMKHMGLKEESILSVINSSWNSKYENLYKALKNVKSYKTAKSPTSFNHRYFTEDIPFGLVPMSILASIYGIKVPYISNLIRNCSLCISADYFAMAPTIEESLLKEIY